MSKQQELADRIDDVKELLEKGITTAEITQSLSAQWEVGQRTIERYIAHAKDIIRGDIKQQEVLMQELRAEVINDEIRNSILSTLELEAKLCAIIEGKLMAEKLVRNKEGQVVSMTCLPSHRDIIYAIDRLFRRRGSYDKNTRKMELPRPYLKVVVKDQQGADAVNRVINEP